MKKLFVGILSLFLLFGASFLTACGSKGTTLTLSKQAVEIQIHAGDEEGYEIVTAEVSGTDKASISANAKSSYESIVKVTTSKVSDTKVSIKIEGLTEGTAEITVKSGSQTKYIHATVYSEVSQMSQKVEDGVKTNYIVRGQNNLLEENKLIEFTPSSKSRRTITWSLAEPQAGLSLINNSLSVGNEFIGDNISLIATTEKDVQTTITLPVLDKIENEVNLGFSYSKSTAFEQITEENNSFNIVPNVSTDEKYQGYIMLDYVGDLEISGYALNSQGQITDDIIVNRDGSLNDKPVFVIYANKEKTNINQNYTIYFKIGYKNYDYALNTLEICPIEIIAREMVNGVIISTYGSGNIENSTQTLYTEYADSNYSSVYGQQFNIMMIPSTVIGATNKYSITLSRVELGDPITKNENDCPIDIWYRDVLNNNVWTFLPLEYDSSTGNFTTNSHILPSTSSLFLKASSENLIVQSAEGLKITFTSDDNKNISSSFNLKLVRSVSQSDFVFTDGDFKVDSSVENVTLKKQFTLKGQTSIEGLDIITDTKAVKFDKIHYISNDEESVTFEIALTLKKASYGITTLDTYNVIHKNGLVSETMYIDIFLPLKEAGMYVDRANNISNSIVDTDFNKKTYDKEGNLLTDTNESLSTLMLKNNTTTPLIYIYNQINNISAVANISVDYFDYDSEMSDLASFISLAESEEGVASIIALAKDNKVSNVATFNGDYSAILTTGVGHTYAVVYLTGKGTENVDEKGNVTYVRVIRIESLVTPEGMNITPDSDKQVSLYSIESLATSDEDLTRHNVSIRFNKSNVTYKNITNLTFISRNEVMGSMSRSQDGNTVSWEFGRYTISNISLTNEGITFTIAALHTYGEYIFTDTLDIHYVIYNADDDKVYDISSSIKVTINNAQRIESLVWENYDREGLYFEVGDNTAQHMLFKTTPTNSKNKSVAYIITDDAGVAESDKDGNQTFVTVSNNVSSNTLSVNLNISQGKTGYIYVLPADAIYNNQIKYYYKDGTTEREGYLSPSELGSVIDNEGTTNYDYLIANAYFKSAVLGGEVKEVEFKEILLKIKITVADGKSFEHAYRIYDSDTFNSIGLKTNVLSSYSADKYYTVMTSLDLGDERMAISNFTGGLQGYNNDVTIKLNGSNFATTLGSGAQIRNIKFNGDVTAEGFLANENKGTISNVTIDVNEIQASTLTIVGNVYGGGIVGTNSGIIDDAKVLGLSITGEQAIIGGIAGKNSGTIRNSSVEFYNLLAGQDENGNIYGSNKFIGNIVGAIVGEICANSSISYTYAYDYTLASGSDSVIVKTGVDTASGAFAGKHSLRTGEKAIIDYAFSVVGQINPYNGYSTDEEPVTMTNYYFGYYDGEIYTVRPESITSNSNFIQTNDNDFDNLINNGFPYLKNLQQSEKVTSVAYDVQTIEENGYYKSVEVDSNNAILFYYALKDSFTELTNAEANDLAALNTITLSQLVGQDVSKNVIITSSDFSKVKVVGSSIIIRKTGEVELMLASKQNVTLNKTIKVKIVSPLSKVQISWTDLAEKVNYVDDNAQLSLQKTRSRDLTVSFYRPNVYLGALATSYDIVENNYSLNITSSVENGGNAIESQIINNKQFKLIASDDSSLTTFTLSTTLFDSEDEIYQTAINNEFARTFKVLPTEGVINFAISGKTLTISPSINESVKAEIQTTAENDVVIPVISINGVTLEKKSEGNIHKYTILGERVPILEVVVSEITDDATKEANRINKVKTYLFNINFAVAEEIRAFISDEYDFDVILISNSGNSSEEWGGKFSIHISQQEFTNIDVSNMKIKSTTYLGNPTDGYKEVYTIEKITSVLAPGNSSILQVSVNPEYAYYDYVEFTYSGATVSNAVNVVIVEPYGTGNTQYTKKTIKNNNIETIDSRLVYRPSIDDNKTTIYYKLWINTTVNRDTTLMFTATFYKNGEKMLDYVNYYITISYLTEPTITVDGANVTYLAKGSSADIKIDVLLDQRVDSLILEGRDIQGISISELDKGTPDPERGIRTYTAKIYATVLASTGDKNTFYLRARVSRELNGAKETKDSIATVVIVDFKVPADGISISNSKDNNLTIWQGVSKPFMVDYNILPESYPYPSTPEIADAIEELRNKREDFEKYEYYPVKDTNNDNEIDDKDASYFVNYIYNDKTGKFTKQSLYDRLFVVVNNTAVHVSDSSVDLPFKVDHEGSAVSFRGTRISGSINMVLKTYITSGYATQTIETPFTITVEAYSDPDLPIKISTATEFNNLNPDTLDDGVSKVTNDYILENDIFLENYTSFNTDLISSFDGNGHTIYIKSFNLENTQSSTLNLALFNNVKSHTTLKNVRVNLYNGGQLTINVSQFKAINIAGLAIENAGVITNSEVVSFYSTDRAVGEIISDSACTKHNLPQGINVNYVDANGTDSVYLPDNANWSSQVAGFVINNTGSITNSRVGGGEIIIVGAERQINGKSSGYTYASTLTLDTFHLVGQGNIAGFVLTNSGYITSSFVKNIDIENQSNSISFFTSGFAGTNNNSILTSYIEGAPSDEASMPKSEYSQYAFEDTSIRSKLGYIVGFIYENEGSIKDSYSNILIANSIDTTRVYYASGFVYMNSGTVENCYSASQIANSKYSQMNFSGVNESGDLLMSGEYINCYFFNKAYENSEDPNDYTTESQYSTGAQLIATPADISAYYGFAIAGGENDGIWRTDDQRGIALIEANKTTISNRYTYYVDEDSFDGITAEDSTGRKYILPYSVLTFVDSSREIDTSLGGDSNPILIYDAQDFIEISGTSQSTYVQQYFNENAMWGSYRLVNNINLLDAANSEETVALPSSSKGFAGRLYGNGFAISGISISANGRGVAFGLFKSIEKRNNSTPIITNLDLVISQVIAGDMVMVGGLAGYIKDATIINLDISFAKESSMITGLNFVGGLAGLASGNNIIKNINITNPTALAERRAGEEEIDVYFNSSAQLQAFRTKIQNSLNYNTLESSPFIQDEMKKYSYAGSLIGFIDNYSVDNKEFNINQSTNYSINNIRVNGVINVQGHVVGGIIGLTGYQTNVNDMGLTVDMTKGISKIVSTKYFAGGVIGQSFGGVSRTFASYDQTTQNLIEDNLAIFYNGNYNVERGQLDIFSSDSYTQKYVGGLIGYVGSGKLSVSYSKLNVTAMSADYAGGVIGGIEVASASTYRTNTENEDSEKDTYTKYLINEVYASGDVRANTYAGGIIGVIKGEDSRIALLAVNSVNFFTNYDYENNKYNNLSNTVKNMSITIQANSIVGHMIDNDGNIDDDVDETTYTDYITFMRAGESYQSSGSMGVRDIPSIGYYEGYYINNENLVTLNIFGKIDGRIDAYNHFYTREIVFAIAKPLNYTDSTIGHTYTQVGFINSGAWTSENWSHPSQDLFPSIRYKRSFDVVFLDQYNIHDVFSMMSEKNTHVIVRGKETPEADTYGDIDLINYYKTYGDNAIKIGAYSGILEGGGATVIDEVTNTERDVKIISDQNFIESTAPGFSVINLTIDYKGQEYIQNSQPRTYLKIKNGLFSQSDITESAISNLTINLDSPVVADLTAGDVINYSNAGIIAPEIKSTSILGLKINSTTTEAALQVTARDNTNLNVGLIAGTAVQESQISIMAVEDIKLDISSILLINGVTTGINAGTYFGQITRDIAAQPVKITLESITGKANVESTPRITTNIISNPENQLITLGGYVGYSENIELYSYTDDENNETFVDFEISSKNNIGDVYIGGVVGLLDETSISGADSSAGSEVKSTLYMNLTDGTNKYSINNLVAGGIVGGQKLSETTVGKINITKFNTIDFDVVYGNTPIKDSYSPNKESLAGNYDNPPDPDKTARYVDISGSAKVGVVAGYSKGEFSYTASDASTQINSQKQTIRLSGNNLTMGSVLGQADSTATITGAIISSAEFMVSNSSNTAVVGGILGNSTVGNVTINGGTASGKKITYLGAVYSNAKNLVFGGMLGNFDGTGHLDSDLINVKDTIFGGVVKVYGENSENANITTGGTVGNIALTTKALIQNNYNYGDVFVEYGSGVENLTAYNFGGIIGSTAMLDTTSTIVGSSVSLGIKENYSLVTSHNARYSTATGTTAHALFGNGNPWGASATATANYYSHAVCLLVDELGCDANYKAGTTTEVNGYGSVAETKQLTSEILGRLHSTVKNEVKAGHKLDPTSNLNSDFTFNGMIYYTGSVTEGQLEINIDGETDTTLTNVAIIGNTRQTQRLPFIGKSIVEVLTGYSSISGLALNVEADFDVEADGIYAPVVKEMSKNAIVYAINVAGSMNIGGGIAVDLAGIVGDFQGGKIFDCSTDIDINYRAGVLNSELNPATGTVYGLTKATSTDNKLIENSYTGGSISTMVKANIYAFTNGTSAIVNNSYTYTKLDPKDYLNATTQVGTIGAFGSATASNCYYDIDGLNYQLTTDETDNKKQRSTIGFSGAQMPWESDNDFNFGYPTLKYQYLKNSSFVKKIGENSQGAEGYDSFVITNTYERYANGIRPESNDEKYYLVPNGAVLLDNTLNTNNNFVLRYDIDLTKESSSDVKTGSLTKQICIDSQYSMTLDGNGKTINGLTNSLFVEISDGTIKNLRLTEVNISNAPALANTISGGIISNMTFSGNITNANGSITNGLTDSEINTTTNMINLVYTDTDVGQYRVGGLVGILTDSTIRYSSNYGPVRIYHSGSNNGYDDNVGGLVGLMESGTIEYSYNATSVLGNYANETSVSISKGTFFTGGLVGYLEGGTISNSYNSGMVKSGNKSNNVQSYAGGIVGYASAGTISTCYNEGTVEALGTDPSWKIVSIKNETKTTGFKLVITGSRNVWAYGVGFIGDDASLDDNTTIRLKNEKEFDLYEKSIKNNGMYYDAGANGIVLKAWDVDDIYQNSSVGYNIYYPLGYFTYARYYHMSTNQGTWSMFENINSITSNLLKSISTTYKLKDLNADTLTVTSINENGLPRRIIAQIEKTLTLNMWASYTEYDWTSGHKSDSYSHSISFTDFASAEFNIHTSEITEGDLNGYTYNNGIYKDEDMRSNKRSDNQNIFVYENQNEIKEATRSKQETDASLIGEKTITVAGQNFYVADTNNFEDIFNGGIYSQEVTLTFENIPYTNDYSCYTLTTNNPSIKTKIKSVSTTTIGSTQVLQANVIVYSDDKIDVSEFTLDYKYENVITPDLTNLHYSYVEGGKAIGIDIDGISFAKTLTGYNLNNSYENIIKVSTTQYNIDNNYNEDRDPSGNFIYLAVDKDNERFIYVPNASLYKSNGENPDTFVGQVNKINGISQGAELTYDNIEKIISEVFAGKTLYYKSVESESTYINISEKITDFSSVAGEFTAGESTDNLLSELPNSFVYGKTYTTTTNDFIVEYVDKTYSLEFANTLLADDLIVLNGENPIISYNKTQNALGLGANTTFIIGEEEYTFSLDGNKIIINSDSITEENTDIVNSIKDFFNNMTYITNQVPVERFVISDQFGKIPSTITLKDDGKQRISIDRTVSKQWLVNNKVFENGEIFIEDKYSLTNSGSSVIITLNKDNLNKYSLNGVEIYKDTININTDLKQKYSSILGNITVYAPNNGLNSYFELQVSGDKIFEYKNVALASSGGHGFGSIIGGGEELTGNYNVSATFFETYAEKSYTQDESSEYGIVATKDGNSYYAVVVKQQDTSVTEPTYQFVTESTSQLFDDYAISVSTEEGMETEGAEGINTVKEGESYTEYTFSDYYFKNELLVLRKYEDDTVYQVTKTMNEKDPNDPNKPEYSYSYSTFDFDTDITVNGVTYSITDIKSLYDNTMDNCFELYKDNDGKSYIYLKNVDFKISDETLEGYYEKYDGTANDNIENDGTVINGKISLNTRVKSDIYSWKEFTGPSYNTWTHDLPSGMTDATITVGEGSKYQLNENSIEIYLKVAGVEASASETVTIEKECNDVDNYNLKVETANESCPIILAKDLSFNNGVLQNNDNLIGNGYYISYYDNSFYETLSHNEKFFKQVSFLGEVYDQVLFNNISSGTDKIEFESVDFYGSVINLSTEENVIINSHSANFNNTNSFIAVNGARGYRLNLFGGSILDEDSVSNYGTIIAAYNSGYLPARDGINSEIKNGATRAAYGRNGDNGQSINVSSNDQNSSEMKISNKGIVKAGDGGNGSASGIHIDINHIDIYHSNSNLEVINSGKGGAAGTCNGFENSIAGKKGKNGASVARKAFLSLEANLDTNLQYLGDYYQYGDPDGSETTINKTNIQGIISYGLYTINLTAEDYGQTHCWDHDELPNRTITDLYGVINYSGMEKILSVYTLTKTEQKPAEIYFPDSIVNLEYKIV